MTKRKKFIDLVAAVVATNKGTYVPFIHSFIIITTIIRVKILAILKWHQQKATKCAKYIFQIYVLTSLYNHFSKINPFKN
ncbi:hypothetical protein DERF_007687 [Dermatophagoides farinae]|uniref:Uncharacterized protein n=1 Tax=Dermatophagoides farinae TaxID=6954 RepID=A0A922L4R1_DERFA|nr:hypothetical protein DERF_007687 [Dermatophagoides farinae]